MALFLFVAFTVYSFGVISTQHYRIPPELLLGSIIPLYDERLNWQTGIMAYEALKFAVAKANKEKYLFGYKLKLDPVLPSVFSDNKNLFKIIRYLLRPQNMTAIIGPANSYDSDLARTLSSTFAIPMVSYTATSTVFDDISNCRSKTEDYEIEYMFSTVPSDTFRLHALLKLLKAVNINYISIVASMLYNGHYDARKFVKMLPEYSICLANDDIPQGLTDIEKYLDILNNDGQLKTLVLFTVNEDSRKVLAALKKRRLERRFLLIFVYESTNFVEVTRDYEQVAVGSISISLNTSEQMTAFKKHYLQLNPSKESSKIFHLFWEDLFQCNLREDIWKTNENMNESFIDPIGVLSPETATITRKIFSKECSGKEKLDENMGYYSISHADSIIKAVSYIVKSIQGALLFLTWYCESEFKQSLHNCTMNTLHNLRKSIASVMCFRTMPRVNNISYDIRNYRFDGALFKNEKVGFWKVTDVPADFQKYAQPANFRKYANVSFFLEKQNMVGENYSDCVVTNLVCSKPCSLGRIRVPDSNPSRTKCCWTCSPCEKNHIVINNTCKKCGVFTSADLITNNCMPLPERYIVIRVSTVALIFMSLVVIGWVVVLVIVVVFIRYNDKHVVRASGRDLSYPILIAALVLFSCPALFLHKPNQVICACRDILPNLSFLTCYASLTLKTFRIYRIFESGHKRVSRPVLVSSCSQLSILSIISIFQFVISGISFAATLPEPEKIVSSNELYVTVHCKDDRIFSKIFVNLLPSIVFMIVCTILAIKTRKYPKNYNEAQVIGFTLYVTCLCWGLFLPMYLIPSGLDNYFHEFLRSALCISIGFITIIGLFGHKIWILYQGIALEDHHDSLKSRARSLSSRSSHKECNMNGSWEDVKL